MIERGKTLGEGAAKNALQHLPQEFKSWVLKRGIERILLTTTYDYPPKFWPTIREYGPKAGFVVVQDHLSLADILAGDRVANEITQEVNGTVPEDKRMGGFIEPFAWSLKNGTQAVTSQLYLDVESIIGRLRVETNPTPTLNDVINGRVRTYEDYAGSHRRSTRRMIEAATQKRKSVILSPEATVKGGKINPETGEIYGMQIFAPGAIKQGLKIVTQENEFGILIPVAVSGGCSVFNSENNEVTMDAIKVGFGASNQALMEVHVGTPIIYRKADVRSIDAEKQDYEVGTTIANMLRPNEQGVYGNPQAFELAVVEYRNKQAEAQKILQKLEAEYKIRQAATR